MKGAVKDTVKMLGLGSLLMASSAVYADHNSISYDYIEGGVSTQEASVNGNSEDGTGVDFRASMTLTPNVFIKGGLQSASLSGDVDALRLDASVGYRHRIANDANNPVDMYATLGVESIELEDSLSNVELTGLLAALGFRVKLLPSMEGVAELQYRSLDSDNNGTFDGFGYVLGVVYRMSHQFDIGLFYEYAEVDNGSGIDLDTQAILIKGRYRFR